MRKFKHKKTGWIVEQKGINPETYYNIHTGNVAPDLVENSNDWKEIIEKPEYVKCITDIRNTSYILNKIYKVNPNSDYVIGERTSFAKWNNSVNHMGSRFEPSTKEAYDLQELKAKFVVDKWYSITTKPRDTVYKNIRFKVESVEDTLVTYKYDNYINHNNIYGDGNGMEFKNIIDVKELLVESNEIQQYLPDNHVDKIKPQLDYEILSFTSRYTPNAICIKHENGRFGRSWGDKTVEEMLTEVSNNFRKIHSVKRLSDGEVFTVGDKMDVDMTAGTNGNISSFKVENLGIKVGIRESGFHSLQSCKHKKPVLFTTHDGVDIYDEDTKLYYATIDGKDVFVKSKQDFPTGVLYKHAPLANINKYHFFSSYQACEKYIDVTFNLPSSKTDLITVQLTKEKYDLLMQLLEE